MAPDTVIIVNPKSQGGATGRRWPALASEVRKHFPFEVKLTEAPRQATELTRAALAAGAERIIAVGGDGTINEVINGFFVDGAPIRPSARFGLLPLGTGGDFRRTLQIPTDLDEAAALIARDTHRPIDIGQVRYAAHDGTTATHMFANIASFGLSGKVDQFVNKSGKRFGRLSFAVATVRAAIGYHNQRVRLRFDDDPASVRELTISTVAVANGKFFGGAMKIAPDAEPDDGLFDVVCLGDLGTLDVLTKGNRLYAGTHLTMPEVSARRGRVVDAELVEAGQQVELDIDGENLGRLPARFELHAHAVRMIAPVR